MSDVRVVDRPEQSRYEAYVDDELAGIAVYELRAGPEGEIIEFTHTEVDDAHEGHGVGSALARTALDDVRRVGRRRVIASCPFIADWIERHPEYQELLASDESPG